MARKKKAAEEVEVVKEAFDTPVAEPVLEPVVEEAEAKEEVKKKAEEVVEETKDSAVGEVLFPLVVGLVADGYQAGDIKARVKAVATNRDLKVDLTKFYEQRFTKEMILVLSELK